MQIIRRRAPYLLVVTARALALCALFLIASLAPSPPPALASALTDKQAELAAAQSRLDGIQADIDRLTKEWAETEDGIRASEAAIEKAVAETSEAKADLEEKRAALAERIAGYYKEAQGSAPPGLEVVLGGESISDTVKRLPLLADIVQQDRQLLDEVDALTTALALKQEELAKQRSIHIANLSALAITKEELSRLLEQAAKERAKIQRQVDVLTHADELARASAAARSRWRGRVSARTISRAHGFTFPLDGPHSFIHDWGFPRPDDRVHKGTDVMAPYGASVVAAHEGTISRVAHKQPLGGTVIWLLGDNGVSYYYAHLSKVAPDVRAGMRVVAGYPIGNVGDTGNARGGDPHLHFGMYPGGGAAVDPYLTLRISD